MSDPLADLRTQIEAVDDALIDALAERAMLVRMAWAHKDEVELPRLDAEREAQVIARLLDRAEARGLDRVAIADVLATIVGKDLGR